MTTSGLIALLLLGCLGVGGAIYGVVHEYDAVSEAIGRGLAVMFLVAAFGGTAYGLLVVAIGHDPLGFGFDKPAPASDLDGGPAGPPRPRRMLIDDATGYPLGTNLTEPQRT